MGRAIFNPTVNYKSLTLTEEQPRKIIFKKFDTNNGNRFSKEERKKAFSYLGSKNRGFRAGRALHHADAYRDRFIDEEEMDELVKYAKKAGFPFVGNECLGSKTLAFQPSAPSTMPMPIERFIDEEEMNELVKYAKKAGFTYVGDECLPTAKDAREAQLKEFCEKYAEKGVLSRAEIKIAYQCSKEAELNKLVEDIERLGYRVQPRNP